MTGPSSQEKKSHRRIGLADRLHSAAIHLLRGLRRIDAATGLSAPRLSALSVIVFAGPIRLKDLAAAEQVRPPTMSRLVRELERAGLVRRHADRRDRRVQWLRATARGKRLLAEGRARRIGRLAGRLERVSAADIRTLERSVTILEGQVLRGGGGNR